jgi:hypothetical protein
MGGMPPRRCLLGKRCLPNTPLHPVYKWVSHNAIIQESYLCLFLCLFTLYYNTLSARSNYWVRPRSKKTRATNSIESGSITNTRTICVGSSLPHAIDRSLAGHMQTSKPWTCMGRFWRETRSGHCLVLLCLLVITDWISYTIMHKQAHE